MKVLIVGSGAREHVLAWKVLQQSPDCELYVAPGNLETRKLGRALPIEVSDIGGLVQFARDADIDLTIVGPEGPLAAGIVDVFHESHLAIYGPSASAAMIESSKAWAKAFMMRHEIPTARFEICHSIDEIGPCIHQFDNVPVIKDDGLAGGKGVTVATTFDEAAAAARKIFETRADAQVVVEERLEGWELSIHAFCDGTQAKLMPPACDYKRLRDGDRGPNTGGMGAYSPSAVGDQLLGSIQKSIVEPAIRGMASEGRPFVGVLYPGLMITSDGPKVLEFNCRFGDPEAQAILPLLESNLLEIILDSIAGRLGDRMIQWSRRYCCAVVVASPGYPDNPQPAEPRGYESIPSVTPFRGGASGRLLTVSALGDSLADAREEAYAALKMIDVGGGKYRRDIAAFDRALGV